MQEPISIKGDEDSGRIESRIAAGDRAAEEELVARFAPRVRAFVASRAPQRNFTDEVVQDTIMALISILRDGRLRESENLSGLVYGIARNKLADALRKQARSRTVPFPVGFDCAAPVKENNPELVSAAQREIGRMEPADRRILEMTLLEGCNAPEVAQSVGMSIEAVRQRKSRALKKLVDRLKPLSRIAPGLRLNSRRPESQYPE